MKASKAMKMITGAMEGFLAIPLLGAIIIIATGYYALIGMLILHVLTFVLSIRDKNSVLGPMLGVFASLLGVIPFLGWFLHLIASIVLIVGAFKRDKNLNVI